MRQMLSRLIAVTLLALGSCGNTALDAIAEAEKQFQLPTGLLKAVCSHESNLDIFEYNHADGMGDNHAIGLCQVLVDTAQHMGQNVDGCSRDYRYTPRTYRNCPLFGPRINANVAAQYLKKHLVRYNNNIIDAVSAYNAGSVRKCTRGWLFYKGEKFKECKIGSYLNGYYIKSVMRRYLNEI